MPHQRAYLLARIWWAHGLQNLWNRSDTNGRLSSGSCVCEPAAGLTDAAGLTSLGWSLRGLPGSIFGHGTKHLAEVEVTGGRARENVGCLSADEIWQRILGRTAELTHEACTQLIQTSQEVHLFCGRVGQKRTYELEEQTVESEGWANPDAC